MKLHRLSIIGLLLLLYVPFVQLSAQQMKIVSGTVVNKEDKKPFASDPVYIYPFNTVAEAEDAKKVFDDPVSTEKTMSGLDYAVADPSGYYEVRVPDNGALIFKVGLASSVLEKVNARMQINVAIDAGILLEPVSVVADLPVPMPTPRAPIQFGNKLVLYNTFPIPAQYGRENGRLIIQPYVIDCVSGDTAAYARPLIFDGEQYHLTQDRRMGYDLSNDPLARFISAKRLTAEKMQIDWADTVIVPDADRNYHGDATIQLEDYNTVFYSETYLVTTCETKRPLKFLEYSIGNYELDPEKYRERPKREKRNTSRNISLTFLIGKAELDPDNPDNEQQMDELRRNLLDIVNGEGSTLKEFHVTGVASPEGRYQSNLKLAQERVRFAQERATSLIPKNILARVYQNPQAKVASWADVAELLEKDSLIEMAEGIREIIRKHPQNQDAQFAAVSRLSYYATTIKEYLPKLRSVHYEYIHEIYRELTPEEIYDKYLNDADYRNGKKEFALYEYWHLFNMEKDPKKLRQLYKDAYEASKKTGRPWVYAANNLAVSYLKENICDTTILAPFINTRIRKVNVEKRMDGILMGVVNQEEVVANQLAMYLKANDFDKASILAQILPEERFGLIRAFTLCLGGYYQGGQTKEEREEAKRIFNVVKDSSPLNEVVMYLALDSPQGNVYAERALGNLSDDNPVSWYLKAILYSRKDDLNMGSIVLAECFRRDGKYIPIAEQDGDLKKDIVELAKDTYEF